VTLINTIFLIAVSGFTLAAAVSDLRTRKLPNWLTVPAFALALVAHTAANGLPGLGFSLLGFVAGFGILLVLWLIGGSGGGDVKLMGALGAWLGARLTLRVFFVSAGLIGAYVSVAFVFTFCTHGFIFFRRRYLVGTSPGKGTSAGDDQWRRQQRLRCRIMPYAVPVAVSTWLVLVLAWRTAGLPL
jgi:prepilin peptidase CpaA